ncbi:MAG: ATP-dependent helicase [Saprospiraceae bacterium]|nr:ATP-dependent helicase [Saprospiraceae bacterium]
MSTIIKSSPDFEKAYQKLNERQKEAVDLLEGPLMVIAGPGTGKTQILAIRIGNILLQTDANPKNILCLTYTEAGATAMRQRLLQFIGPTAYEITICTFHSFCNTVIRENPDSFNQYSDYEVVSELEKNQLLLKIMEGLDRKDILFKYNGKYNTEFWKLQDLFSTLKKENWNPLQILTDIDLHLEQEKSNPDRLYKRKSGIHNPGDFKQKDYTEYCRKFDRTKSALQLYHKYQAELDQLERYEYEDMIRWVIEKFETDDSLLAKYQEIYQYVLVDEYQDTNGAQNKLLFQLLSYFETANIFAVGDDDQAIYRFQGANVQNMTDFDMQYQPQKIVLIENYRSSQIILDAADSVIQHNQERLVHSDVSLVKKLIAAGSNGDSGLRPIFTECSDSKSEILDVCQQIQDLLKEGVEGKEIAVLFRKNKEAEAFIKWFEANTISYQTNRQINILNDLLLQHILNILRYLSKEYQESFTQDGLLFKIIHAPYIHLPVEDISRLAWYLQSKKKDWFDKTEFPPEFSLINLLANEPALKVAGIKEIQTCLKLSQKLNELRKQILDFTPQGVFEKILTDFNVLDFILKNKEKIQQLQVLNAFFEFLKAETQKNPLMTLMEFIDLLEEYQNNAIQLPNTQFIGTKKGVVLSTIHGSKGLEYDYVFMINNTHQNWNQKDTNKYKLPDQYVNSDVNTEEDNRRLFYVGLTRARKGIYLSYPRASEKKDNTVCRYVAEMQKSELVDFRIHQTNENDLIDKIVIDLSPMKKNYERIEDQHFEKFLEYFSLNPTALNKYLECPLSFYYEKVLQIPGARTAPLGFGNAVHLALELFMRNRAQLLQNKFDTILHYFQKGMEKYRSHFTTKEYANYLQEGKAVLPGFLKMFAEEWKEAIDIKIEQKIKTEFKSVPISGKLDRIDWLKDGIRVVDYKTGKPDPKTKVKAPNTSNPQGSSYWQQMVFYSILLKNHSSYKNSTTSSVFYFVNQTADKTYEKKEILPTAEDIQLIEGLIVETYEKIKNRIFTPGCGKPNCEWCGYINSGVELSFAEVAEDDEVDDSF